MVIVMVMIVIVMMIMTMITMTMTTTMMMMMAMTESMMIPITMPMMVSMMHGYVRARAVWALQGTLRAQGSAHLSLSTPPPPPRQYAPHEDQLPHSPYPQVLLVHHCARSSRDQHWAASKALTPSMASGHSHTHAHSVGLLETSKRLQ